MPKTNPCYFVTGKAPDLPFMYDEKKNTGKTVAGDKTKLGFASYWKTQSDWDGDYSMSKEGEGGADFSYQPVFDCFSRESKRNRQLQDFQGDDNIADKTINAAAKRRLQFQRGQELQPPLVSIHWVSEPVSKFTTLSKGLQT